VSFATPSATDNCAGTTVSCSPGSGSSFNKGVSTVTCTATDAVGNTTACTFTVTVNDTEKPTTSCASDIAVTTPGGSCASNVIFTAPASDNCPGVTSACVPASGSAFGTGITTVTCTATDTSGNTNACTFTVTVTDSEAPTISCPGNINVSTAPGSCASNVIFFATPSDNCSGVTYVCVPASGSAFGKGTIPVICTATDASGNTASCNFNVTVNDTEAPHAICPANIVVSTAPGSCASNVTFSASVTDNCPGSTI